MELPTNQSIHCNSDAAIDDLTSAIDGAKNLVEQQARALLIAACLQRGILWAARGETYLAIDDFTVVIHLDNLHAEAHYRRAIAFKEAGEQAGAEADFDRASYLDPANSHLRRKFLDAAVPTARATWPDIRFGQTIVLQK